jgi:hypothetical protein
VEEHENGKVRKKISENIYIVLLVTGYLIGMLTLFRSLIKKNFKNDKKPIKTL